MSSTAASTWTVSTDVPGAEEILTPAVVDFVARLQREHGLERDRLLNARAVRQAELDAGAMPDFPAETDRVRDGDWRVAEPPPDLQDRRVEITGPVERKMMINALNSGANVFMADLEDALSPTWENVVAGQQNLVDAVEGSIELATPGGKHYRLDEETAVLVVRPRGWHLVEKHVLLDGAPVSASLLDFGLYFFHNAERLLERGTGPYFYLPKLENRLEARLWNAVFEHAQELLGLPRGTIKATVLIENVLAAFEMDEILYELREHSAGLNAGRWDYIFSVIKKFRNRPDFLLPDRVEVTMTVPFMRAYTDLLVRTCHRRGAHAIGGMAAFIPSRKDPDANRVALAKVREDKVREAGDGFDGTWVAHPDLVPVAKEVFDEVLGERPNQRERLREDVSVDARGLLDVRVPGAGMTDGGVRANVSVGIRYLESWLRGTGAAAIFNLMEDAATAEISRSQIWQWVRHGAVDERDVRRAVDEEMRELQGGRFEESRALFEEVALSEEFVEFLTIPAYEHID